MYIILYKEENIRGLLVCSICVAWTYTAHAMTGPDRISSFLGILFIFSSGQFKPVMLIHVLDCINISTTSTINLANDVRGPCYVRKLLRDKDLS